MARHNGRPSISLSVQKRAGENIVRICDEVRQLLQDQAPKLPAGLKMTVVFDESKDIRNMVADLPNHFELLTAMRGGIDPGESHISLGAASNSAALARAAR